MPMLNRDVDILDFPEGKGILVSGALFMCPKDISHFSVLMLWRILIGLKVVIGFCLNVCDVYFSQGATSRLKDERQAQNSRCVL